MTYSQTTIHQGGLKRCCIDTIAAFCEEHANEEAQDGMTLYCGEANPKFTEPGIRLVYGVWQHNGWSDEA